jgi:hypothetical protein
MDFDTNPTPPRDPNCDGPIEWRSHLFILIASDDSSFRSVLREHESIRQATYVRHGFDESMDAGTVIVKQFEDGWVRRLETTIKILPTTPRSQSHPPPPVVVI